MNPSFSRLLLLLSAYLVTANTSAFAVAPKIAPQVRTLINPCEEAYLKNSVDFSKVDETEATAEALLKRLSRSDIADRFHKAPLHGVAVYIVDAQGQVLLAKRKGSHGAGTWAVPGGHIEPGEGIFETGRRELLEETGLNIQVERFIGLTLDHFPEKGKSYYTYHVTAKIVEGTSTTPKVMETEKVEGQFEWHGVESIPTPLFTPLQNFLALDGAAITIAAFEQKGPPKMTEAVALSRNELLLLKSNSPLIGRRVEVAFESKGKTVIVSGTVDSIDSSGPYPRVFTRTDDGAMLPIKTERVIAFNIIKL